MRVPGLRFALLENGYMECDRSFFQLNNGGVNGNRNPPATWVRAPVYSVLIAHPQAGYILYDGGACKADAYGKGGRPPEHEKYMPFYADAEHDIEVQLKKCGVRLADISIVVISHAHWEHMGVLERLAGLPRCPEVLVPKADYGYGLVETHRNGQDVFCTYLRRNFEFPGISYTYVDESFALAPGIDVLLFHGHAPAVIGLLIQSESGAYLFPSDAVMNEKNRSEPARHTSMLYNAAAYAEDVKRLQKLEAQYEATVLYPHDGAQFAALQKAPSFY